MEPIIRISHFSKTFHIYLTNQNIQAISNFSLDVFHGDFIGISGKSGSGKSTILKSIYRTNYPDKGEILYHSIAFGLLDLLKATDRQMIELRKKEIGYVSQFLKLMPRTTAFYYVKQSLLEYAPHALDIDQQVSDMLTHFELPKTLWYVYPNTFSGGEKLRLNIAAAMIKKPRLLLLDEPTASLDDASKMKVKDLIVQLKNEGTTMIGIFHDIDFMKPLCDKHIDMNIKEG